MQSELKAQRNRFVAFAFAAADLLLEVDGDGLITYAAGAGKRLTGHEAPELPGTKVGDVFGPGGAVLMQLVLDSLKTSNRLDPIVFPLSKSDGSEQFVLFGGCRLPEAPGITYLTLSATSRAPAATAASSGLRDPATGLLSRGDFAAAACEAVRVARESDLDPELTVLEMAGLADLRTRIGADKVEGFLRGVGSYLRGRSIGDAAARIADEKYSLMHPAGLDVSALERDIEQISRVADPEQRGVTVEGASIAVGKDLDDGDIARALAFTINKFTSSPVAELDISSMTGALSSMVDETLERIAGFREAIAGGTTRHLFQPIVRLDDRGLHHSELLVRFEDGKSPQEMIGFAEDLRIIPELDIEICRAAVKLLIEMVGAAPIAVNISAHSVENEAFVDALTALLRQASLGGRLIFEITESAELIDLQAANAVIGRLRGLGHKVCLDDFGAGAAGFSYLQALDVDYVKFDGRYVRRVLEDQRSRLMLKAMADLCRELGVDTVGEMIETDAQAASLRDLGIRFGQGYLFGKPSPELPQMKPPMPVARTASSISINARSRGSRETWG